jgi:threonine/homoserine/homoserine lactone efflux protein
MPTLTLYVASIAIADSINPSTVVPALWMASRPRAHLASFTVGVFVAYLAGGLVLVFGPGPALIAALHHVRGTAEHTLEVAGGVVVLAVAVGMWRSRRSQRLTRLPRPGATRSSAFALGAAIMGVELPTAFMYFGAISAVLASHHGATVEVSVLLIYNALFVAPLVVILALRRLAGDRVERWLASGSERLLAFGQLLLTGLTGCAGALLLILGVIGLVLA